MYTGVWSMQLPTLTRHGRTRRQASTALYTAATQGVDVMQVRDMPSLETSLRRGNLQQSSESLQEVCERRGQTPLLVPLIQTTALLSLAHSPCTPLQLSLKRNSKAGVAAHQLGDVVEPLVRLCLRVQDLQPAERLVPLLLVVREGGPREVEHIGRRAVRPGCCHGRGRAGPVWERACTKGSCSQAGHCFLHMHH